MEYLGEYHGAQIYSDFGHHPNLSQSVHHGSLINFQVNRMRVEYVVEYHGEQIYSELGDDQNLSKSVHHGTLLNIPFFCQSLENFAEILELFLGKYLKLTPVVKQLQHFVCYTPPLFLREN